eukprot:3057726-Amphidinium_carterae.1
MFVPLCALCLGGWVDLYSLHLCSSLWSVAVLGGDCGFHALSSVTFVHLRLLLFHPVPLSEKVWRVEGGQVGLLLVPPISVSCEAGGLPGKSINDKCAVDLNPPSITCSQTCKNVILLVKDVGERMSSEVWTKMMTTMTRLTTCA